jgi:hypothetical protein
MKKQLLAIALAFAATFAFADGGVKEPEKPSNECQGSSCSNYGGHGSADAVAKVWATLSVYERKELLNTLNASQKQELMNAISTHNENKNTVSSSLTGNTTTTTIGGTTYSYSQPVAGAFVQLPPGTMAAGLLVVTTTTCGPDFTVEEVRKIQATTNTAAGLFTSTRDNGVVMKTVPKVGGLVYGEWVGVGRDGDQLIEERTVNGFQAITYAYLGGSSASSGINLSGREGAAAIAGSGGVQTFGKEIDKYACSFKETRRLTPAKSGKVEDSKGNVGAGLGVGGQQARPALDQKKARVVTGFRYVVVDDTPKHFCNGKLLPPGKKCVPQAIYGDVVEQVDARQNIDVGTKQ